MIKTKTPPLCTTKVTQNQRGSAVVYILLAIALFAALAFAISNMFSGGQTQSDRELSKLATSEILQFTNGLHRAVQEMKIDGIYVDSLSFENSVVDGYENPNCTSSDCKIFDPSGGNMIYQKPEREWLSIDDTTRDLYGQWYFPANLCAVKVGSDNTDNCDSDLDDNEDIIVILPWLKEKVCTEINEQLGIDNPGGRPPQLDDGGWDRSNPKFIGELDDGAVLDIDGRRVGCFEGRDGGHPPAGSYHFYKILWGR